MKITDLPCVYYGGVPCKILDTGEEYRGTLVYSSGSGEDIGASCLFFSYLCELAEMGYIIVIIQNAGHGSDKEGDPCNRMNYSIHSNYRAAIEITAGEIPAILEDLTRAGVIRDGRIALGGFSLGGCITLSAVAHYNIEVKAIVSLMGSPLIPYDAYTLYPGDHFYPTAILFQTGARDTIVRPQPVQQFYQQLMKRKGYANNPNRLKHIIRPNTDHFKLFHVEAQMWETIADWLIKFL